MEVSNKTILDLCGGTGAWSKPYIDSGYPVINATLPDYDITDQDTLRLLSGLGNVYGILFAFPCTHFAGSGARWWAEKDKDGRTLEDTKILTTGLMIIATCKPHFWCLENPVGRINKWIGKPVLYFNPCDYGDPYTKKTALWGKFNIPQKNPVEPQFVTYKDGSRFAPNYGWSTNENRGVTPSGFAKAFFEANR